MWEIPQRNWTCVEKYYEKNPRKIESLPSINESARGFKSILELGIFDKDPFFVCLSQISQPPERKEKQNFSENPLAK